MFAVGASLQVSHLWALTNGSGLHSQALVGEWTSPPEDWQPVSWQPEHMEREGDKEAYFNADDLQKHKGAEETDPV